MDDHNRESVGRALEEFKTVVSAHNAVLLRVIAEELTSRPVPPYMTREFASARRLDWLRNNFGARVTAKFLSSPEDLLFSSIRSQLVLPLELDGTSHRPVDETARSEWFAATRTGISARGVVADVWPPADLEELCRMTSAVYGAGLPYWREARSFDLISPIVQSMQPMLIQRRAIVPSREDDDEPSELDDLWPEWETRVAVKIGDGCISFGGSYAIYCRGGPGGGSGDGGGDGGGGGGGWKWRYGVHDGEWYSDIYDGIEDYLAFYAHFREQTDQEARQSVHGQGM